MSETGQERATIDAGLERVAAALATADKILLTCHLGPDGDSVGSMVALASLLRAQGKRATLYNPDLVPRRFKWMPLVRSLVHRLKSDARYDVTVVVDCGDRKLLGPNFPKPEVTGTLVALDHHASTVPFGDVWVCDPTASSVGVLVARIARQLGWPIATDAGVGLFVSLVTDTGSFRYSNTNAEALQLAADLVEAGIDPWRISEQMNERVPISRYKLLSAVLAGMELCCDGAVCVMTITHEMIKAAGAAWDQTEGMVNYARAINGVDCGVLITPAKRGGVRVSMRSKGHLVDAGKVCQELGGGGHVGAAGCTLQGELPEARAKVEEALTAAIARARAEQAAAEKVGT